MHKIYVVIDVGQASGYLAVYKPEGKAFKNKFALTKCPETINGMWDLLKGVINNIGNDWMHDYEVVLVIEKVHANIKHGSKASFGFGLNYGAWRMAAISLGLKPILIGPQKWKRYFGLWGVKGMTTKQAEQAKVLELYPESKISQNAAGVVLISEYVASTK